jgi:hypothetical protein
LMRMNKQNPSLEGEALLVEAGDMFPDALALSTTNPPP